MSSNILADTLAHLKSRPGSSERRITELHLTRYFTTVELDDRSVGACMSYYWLPDSALAEAERRIAECIGGDPFAVSERSVVEEAIADCVPGEAQRYFVHTSVAASVASALSARSISQGGDGEFKVVRSRPRDWVEGVESALVVGFGGYFEALAGEKTVKKLHAIDLTYDHRRRAIDAEVERLRQRFPGKSINVSARLEGEGRLRDFDLISITGSTLCNGTLEAILADAGAGPKLILQGQSASLHPKFLFEAGVGWVATTVKTEEINRLARGDHGGAALRPLLEGGLPWVYLVPHSADGEQASAGRAD